MSVSLICLCVCNCRSGKNTAEVVSPLSWFNTVLSPDEFAALEQAGSKMAALTTEELNKMRDEEKYGSKRLTAVDLHFS